MILFALGCSSISNRTMALSYQDFGPQVAAYKTIGMEWWQWDNVGDCNPNYQYDVKVVVYRNASAKTVKAAYPVSKELKHDYRYLKYEAACDYLDNKISELRNIDETWAKDVVITLKRTRVKIAEEINKKN